MLQTIQFDPDADALQEVLNTIARSYGYLSANHALGHRDRRVPSSPRPTRWSVANRELVKQDHPSDDLVDDSWNPTTTAQFLKAVTRNVQRALALMVIEGQVSLAAVAQHLGIQEMRGTFSSVGAAQNRIEALRHAEPPYRRVAQPERSYQMDNQKRHLFFEAFFALGNTNLLEEAEAFLDEYEGVPE